MFYVMYIYYKDPFDKLVRMINNSKRELDVIKTNEQEILISTDAYTLRITKGGNNVKFASEDYSTEFNYCFWFEIIPSYKQWADDLIKFVDLILEHTKGDLVLESNGDKPILLRKSNDLYIDRNIGDGSFPFNLLKMSFEEKVLQRE